MCFLAFRRGEGERGEGGGGGGRGGEGERGRGGGGGGNGEGEWEGYCFQELHVAPACVEALRLVVFGWRVNRDLGLETLNPKP